MDGNNINLESLNETLRNVFKHMVCRKIRLHKSFLNTKKGKWVVCTEVSTPAGLKFFECPIDSYNQKSFIYNVTDGLKDLNVLTVKNTKEVAERELKSFSNQEVPNEFFIVKFPKRQVAIVVGDNQTFVNISTPTYQKLIAKCLNLDFPASIDMSQLTDCFKRRELVTFLLQLAQM